MGVALSLQLAGERVITLARDYDGQNIRMLMLRGPKMSSSRWPSWKYSQEN